MLPLALTQQHAGVADDSAFVTADVCARGVAGAFGVSQLVEASQGFHHDHSRQDSTHTDVVRPDGVQQPGRVERFHRGQGQFVQFAIAQIGGEMVHVTGNHQQRWRGKFRDHGSQLLTETAALFQTATANGDPDDLDLRSQASEQWQFDFDGMFASVRGGIQL